MLRLLALAAFLLVPGVVASPTFGHLPSPDAQLSPGHVLQDLDNVITDWSGHHAAPDSVQQPSVPAQPDGLPSDDVLAGLEGVVKDWFGPDWNRHGSPSVGAQHTSVPPQQIRNAEDLRTINAPLSPASSAPTLPQSFQHGSTPTEWSPSGHAGFSLHHTRGRPSHFDVDSVRAKMLKTSAGPDKADSARLLALERYAPDGSTSAAGSSAAESTAWSQRLSIEGSEYHNGVVSYMNKVIADSGAARLFGPLDQPLSGASYWYPCKDSQRDAIKDILFRRCEYDVHSENLNEQVQEQLMSDLRRIRIDPNVEGAALKIFNDHKEVLERPASEAWMSQRDYAGLFFDIGSFRIKVLATGLAEGHRIFRVLAFPLPGHNDRMSNLWIGKAKIPISSN